MCFDCKRPLERNFEVEGLHHALFELKPKSGITFHFQHLQSPEYSSSPAPSPGIGTQGTSSQGPMTTTVTVPDTLTTESEAEVGPSTQELGAESEVPGQEQDVGEEPSTQRMSPEMGNLLMLMV